MRVLISIFLLTGLCSLTIAQDVQIMFYNVENLFDTINDPLKKDEEFLPGSNKKWDSEKYNQKLLDIYKVIINSGKWNPPAVIGLSEVENETVLRDLVNTTPLKKLRYKYIHHESGDRRGIDVAMIYRSDVFTPICSDPITVDLSSPTRDILSVKGTIGTDTVFFFVNHWPSRISGKEFTEQFRIAASDQLLLSLDSIYSNHANAKVVVMGDFNDEPNDNSIKQMLGRTFKDKIDSTYCLVDRFEDLEGGTTVYTDVFKRWYLFDQIFVSNNINGTSELKIVKLPWILNHNGDPDRTYLGDYYNGGISDHLPVIIGASFEGNN